mgnify:CR=1 FL=1
MEFEEAEEQTTTCLMPKTLTEGGSAGSLDVINNARLSIGSL